MDYKKAYEEALERARIGRLQLLDIGEEATEIEHIFPELKESEDEKMRRTLIEYLRKETTRVYRLEWIAWLEKQEEKKPVEWTELTWKDIVELEGIINNVHYDFSAGIGQESFGKEVLERFRSTKGIEYLDETEQKYW